MKVTVCQLDPRAPYLGDFLAGLKQHVQDQKTDFLLLPEMCFSDWLAADPTPDAARWQHAVEDHARHIANLSELGARAVMSTRPVIQGKWQSPQSGIPLVRRYRPGGSRA